MAATGGTATVLGKKLGGGPHGLGDVTYMVLIVEPRGVVNIMYLVLTVKI
jgi:hypothetical protein